MYLNSRGLLGMPHDLGSILSTDIEKECINHRLNSNPITHKLYNLGQITKPILGTDFQNGTPYLYTVIRWVDIKIKLNNLVKTISSYLSSCAR